LSPRYDPVTPAPSGPNSDPRCGPLADDRAQHVLHDRVQQG